jgi:uncharacterized membrane protein
MITLIVLGALLLLVAAPVSAVISVNAAGRARSELRQVDERLRILERAVAAARTPPSPPPQPAPAPLPTPAPTPAAAPVEQPPVQPPPPAPPPPRPTSVPPSVPPPAASSMPPVIGFEEKFGTRWVVWVGGVALALGGIFLVHYAIEQGLIGPRVRIFLAALLAAALVVAGEWTRRKENLSGLAGVPSAHIPGTLTAAGTTVAYATVYAAYALYGFLDAPVAFVLLGIVALATLAAALLHGPALAGLGVVGAYVAPMLVSTTEPNYWALYIYLAVVSAAAFALARLRMWMWLAIVAIVLGALWTFAGTEPGVVALGAHVFHVLVSFALVATFVVCGLLYGPPAAPGAIDKISSAALSVYLLLAAFLVFATRHDDVALIAFVVLTIATVAIAWRTEAATVAVPVAAALAAAVMADWAVHMIVQGLVLPSGPAAPAIPEPDRYAYGTHLILAGLWSALFGVTGFLAQGRSSRALPPMLWAATAVATPLAMLIALYYRIAALDRSLPFAALALLIAAIYGLATEVLVKREPRPGLMAASAMFATGTLAALALALTFALEKGWLTIALALIVPGAAWIAEQRPLPWLRWLAAIMVGVVMARVAYEPRIVGADLGTTPIFNWLLYGYGVPAAAFWLGGWLLRRRVDDLPARMVDSGAILFTILLAILEIRHYVSGGDIYRPRGDAVEIMLYVNVGLAMTIGLERVRGRTGSIVHDIGAQLIAALTLIAIVVDLIASASPQFLDRPVGGVIFNLILLGYGLPALLAIALALIARATRPISYRAAATVTAVVLALFYLTLETRRLFHGAVLAGPISDAEQYAYSTVWLGFGIVLLAIGFYLRSQPARYPALAVIALTIVKVFLFDTANISGIYRALSAIGLGIVLLGIGWFYQHVLFPRGRADEASGASAG